MLPARHRMKRGTDFAQAVRRGRRAGRPTVVAHLWHADEGHPPLVGLVVSRAVGPAVVRTRTKRRLRHVLSARLGRLPAGALLVVRAQPPARTATTESLAADVDRALARLLPPAGADQGTGRPAPVAEEQR